MELTFVTVLVRTSETITAAVDDELVMMDATAGKYYGLNSVGAEIWRLLESPTSVQDLCRGLTHLFEVPSERCRTEVLQFLAQLQAKGLVRVVS